MYGNAFVLLRINVDRYDVAATRVFYVAQQAVQPVEFFKFRSQFVADAGKLKRKYRITRVI